MKFFTQLANQVVAILIKSCKPSLSGFFQKQGVWIYNLLQMANCFVLPRNLYTLLMLLLLSGFTGYAQITTICPASKDAHISQYVDHINSNNGANSLMEAGKFNGTGGDKKSIFVQFDLSNIPAGAIVQSAVCSLYFSGVRNGTSNKTLHTRLIKFSWSEGTGVGIDGSQTGNGITFMTQPGIYSEIASSDNVTLGDTPGWVTWDVTSYAALWISDSLPNYGIRLAEDPASSATGTKQFATRNNSNAAIHPMLVVTYTLGLSTPDSLNFNTLEANGINTDTSSFYFTNNQNVTYILDSNFITQGDSSHFTILNSFPDTLHPNDSVLVQVAFTPVQAGLNQSTLRMMYSSGSNASVNDITLIGYGAFGVLEVMGNNTSISNGSIAASSSNNTFIGAGIANQSSFSKTFQLINTGTDTINFLTNPIVQLSNATLFTFLNQPTVSFLIPGDTLEFEVGFAPLAEQVYIDTITIVSNDFNSPFKFVISGAGIPQNALNFDGTNDYVAINGNAASFVGANQLTVEAWIKADPTQTGTDHILAVNTSSTGTILLFRLADGLLSFNDGTDSYEYAGGSNLRDNQWHHVAFSYDNQLLKLYIDGRLVKIDRVGAVSFGATNRWSIGQEWDSSPSDFFKGAIDEVRIWSDIRTDSEIANAYLCELSGAEDNLVYYYTFNQAVAGAANSGQTTLTDWGSNAYNGTLTGFALTGATSNWISSNGPVAGCTSSYALVTNSNSYSLNGGSAVTATGIYADTVGTSIYRYDVEIAYQEIVANAILGQNACEGEIIQRSFSNEAVPALEFNRTDQDFIVLDNLSSALAGSNRSIFMWVKVPTGTKTEDQMLVAVNRGSTNIESALFVATNGELRLNHGASTYDPNTTIHDGQWHHVGYTYNDVSNATSMYVDGIEIGNFSTDHAIAAGDYISIAQEYDAAATSNHFEGFMSHIGIWNKALTNGEVATLYKNSVDLADSSLISFYPGYRNVNGANTAITDFKSSLHAQLSNVGINSNAFVAIPQSNFTSTINSIKTTLNGSALTGNSFSVGATGSYNFQAVYAAQGFTYTQNWTDVVAQGITLQPENSFENIGVNAVFTVGAQSGSNYQWFELTDSASAKIVDDPFDASVNGRHIFYGIEDDFFYHSANHGQTFEAIYPDSIIWEYRNADSVAAATVSSRPSGMTTAEWAAEVRKNIAEDYGFFYSGGADNPPSPNKMAVNGAEVYLFYDESFDYHVRLYSADSGKTFTPLLYSSYLQVTDNQFYTAQGALYAYDENGNISKSTNQGSNWITTNVGTSKIKDLAVASGVVYAMTNNVLYTSTDGINFTPVTFAFSVSGMDAITAKDSSVFIAVNNDLVVSTNAGGSWTKLSNKLSSEVSNIILTSSGLYAQFSGVLSLSKNNGRSFDFVSVTDQNEIIRADDFNTLRIIPDNNALVNQYLVLNELTGQTNAQLTITNPTLADEGRKFLAEVNTPNGCGYFSNVAELLIDPCTGSPTSSTITTNSCGGYTAPSGFIYTQSGTYVDTLVNANATGCDSIITLNLTIFPAFATGETRIDSCGQITLNGQIYESSQTLVDTFYNAAASGCDSLHYTILTVYRFPSQEQLVADVNTGSFVAQTDNALFFISSHNPNIGLELYAYDGDSLIALDLTPGGLSSTFKLLAVENNELYYTRTSTGTPANLFKLDANYNETQLTNFTSGTVINDLVILGNKKYILRRSTGASSSISTEIWVQQGTASPVQITLSGRTLLIDAGHEVVNNRVYFKAGDSSNDANPVGKEILVLNTNTNTLQFIDLLPGNDPITAGNVLSGKPASLVVYNNKLYLEGSISGKIVVDSNGDSEFELNYSFLSIDSNNVVAEIKAGEMENPYVFQGNLYLELDSDSNGIKLYRFDGTNFIELSGANGNFSNVTYIEHDGFLYFQSSNSSSILKIIGDSIVLLNTSLKEPVPFANELFGLGAGSKDISRFNGDRTEKFVIDVRPQSTKPAVFKDDLYFISYEFDVYVIPSSGYNFNPSRNIIASCGDPVTYQGITYYTDTILYDTIASIASHACDSVYVTQIVFDSVSVNLTATNATCAACATGKITASVSAVNGISFDYHFSSGDSLIASALTSKQISSLFPGPYAVTVTSEYGCSTTDTVTVLYNGPANRAPIALDDTYSVFKGDTLIAFPLLNDTEPDNNKMSITLLSLPDSGLAYIAARPSSLKGDTLYYIATPTYFGFQQFQYAACDPIGVCDTATITIEVKNNVGTALNFDGSNDYITINGVAPAFGAATQFTLEAWIKADPTQTGDDHIIGINAAGTSTTTRLNFLLDDGVLEFVADGTNYGFPSGDLRDNQWHHVALGFDGTHFIGYVDGEMIGKIIASTTPFVATDRWSIGQEFDGTTASDFWKGDINEVRIWNNLRTPLEINNKLNCALTGNESGLVAYYQFDQGLLFANNSAVTTLNNLTANAANGTLINFTLTDTISNWKEGNVIYENCEILRTCANTDFVTPSGGIYSASGEYFEILSTAQNLDSVVFVQFNKNYLETDLGVLANDTFCIGESATYTAPFNNYVQYLKFTQADEGYVNLNVLTDSLINTDRSIFLWMKQSTTVAGDFQALVGINNPGTATVTHLLIETDEDLDTYDGTNFQTTNTVVTDGIWHHVGYTYNETTNETKTYIDGVLKDTYTNGQSIAAGDRISLGQEFDDAVASNFFNGEMSQIAFYKKPLTAAEVLALYTAAPDATEISEMLAFYPGHQICGGVGEFLEDIGPNALHGSMTRTNIIQIDTITTITNYNAANLYNQQWTLNNAVVATTDSFAYTASSAGSNAIELSLTGSGVAFTDGLQAIVAQYPTVDILNSDSISATTAIVCIGDPITILANTAAENTVVWYEIENIAGQDTLVTIGNGSSISINKSGEYAAQVTNPFGCASVLDTITITDTAKVELFATNISCNGLNNGSITVSYCGFENPVFAWNFGGTTQNLSGLAAGTYTVTVSSANQSAVSASATITEPAPFFVDILQGDTVYMANGDSVLLSVNPVAGVQYEWYDSEGWNLLTNSRLETSSVKTSSDHNRWIDLKVFNNTPYVKYGTNTTQTPKLKRYTNNQWQDISPSFTPGGNISNIYSLAVSDAGTPHIAYTNAAGTNVDYYNGTTWQALGNQPITSSFTTDIVIHTIGNTPYILSDEADELVVRKFENGQWSLVGSDPIIVQNLIISDIQLLEWNNNPLVVFKTNAGKEILSFNGTNWVSVTANVSFTSQVFVSSTNEIFTANISSNNLTIQKWTATGWQTQTTIAPTTTITPATQSMQQVRLAEQSNGNLLACVGTINVTEIFCVEFANDFSSWNIVGGTLRAFMGQNHQVATGTNNNIFVLKHQIGPEGGLYGYEISKNIISDSSTAITTNLGQLYLSATNANGCIAYDTVYVDSLPPCVPSFDAVAVNFGNHASCDTCNNGSLGVTFTNPTSLYSYTWDNNETTQTATMLNAGVHTVTITDTSGCVYVQSGEILDQSTFFISKWKTYNTGNTNDSSIAIPSFNNTSYTWDVDWEGDGIFDDFGVKGKVTHQYADTGTYTVFIKGNFRGWSMQFNHLVVDKLKLLEVSQWGNIQLTSGAHMFNGCKFFNITASDIPNLSGVTSMESMFYGAESLDADLSNWNVSTVQNFKSTFEGADLFNTNINTWNVSSATTMESMFANTNSFNSNISSWDVSSVVTMKNMFFHADSFNQNISSWNVGAVSTMEGMFAHAKQFNQNIDAWDVSKVTNMLYMFNTAESFNANLNSWDVSRVKNMQGMFAQAYNFNGDIENWDVDSVTTMLFLFSDASTFNKPIGNWQTGAVTSMRQMFKNAVNFNQDISNWDVSAVTNMNEMFQNALVFDQNLGEWDMESVANVTNMFTYVSLSTSNYDSTLIGWAPQNLTNNLSFHAGFSNYCLGDSARQFMINSLGWTIYDNGKQCGNPSVSITLNSNESCFGSADGSATAHVSGGASPFTYAWSNGSTDDTLIASAGTYYLTVTDAGGQSIEDSVVITSPSEIVLSNLQVQPDCGANNGSVDITPIGGAGGYTYLWSNGATSQDISTVAAGSYTVSITDINGCSAVPTVNVSNANGILVSSAATNAVCRNDANGSINLTVSGGTPGYNFAWSSGEITQNIANKSAGVYTVSVTDQGGCLTILSDTISQPDLLNIDFNRTVPTCHSDADATLKLEVLNPSGTYTYAWSNGATGDSISGLAVNTYTVTITDQNNCETVDSEQIIAYPAFSVTAILDNNISCFGLQDGSVSAIVSGGIPTYTYSWSNGENQSNTDSLALGTYYVSVTDGNGCQRIDTIEVSQPASMVLSTEIVQEVSCFGGSDGSVRAVVSGGTAPYTFAWTDALLTTNDTLINALADDYSVLVTDANGCTIEDSIQVANPVLLSASLQTINNVSCFGGNDASSTVVASGGAAPYTYLWSNGNTNDTITNLSIGTYRVTISDSKGCTALDSIEITQPNQLIAAATLTLNESCASANDGAVSASATGGTGTLQFTWSNGFNSAVNTNLAAGTYLVTVTDAFNCADTASVVVATSDTVAPTIITQNIAAYLTTNGTVTVSAADVNNGTFDACGLASTYLSQTLFDCNSIGFNTIYFNALDVNGNLDSSAVLVNILDTLVPSVVAQSVTLYLNAAGNASASAGQIDNGSSDNCGINAMNVSPSSFTCNNIGANTVILTVYDNNGNSNTAAAIVTILDTIKPLALAQNIIVQLDANGQANITPSQINNGSSDACGIASLALDSTTFDCGEVGANTVVLTVTDVNGNSSTATATVTVQDSAAPIALAQNITVQLDANGQASITPSQINNGSSDACGIASITLDSTNFDCGEVGANTVVLTVTDVNGNSSTATATVTVQDNVAPIAQTQNITVQLDANGQASIAPNQINDGSTDACGIASLMLDSTNFDCGEVGANTVTLTVTDANGNSSTATATVTVQDNVAPIANAQNITVQLDANGQASITPSQINNGSSDACAIASLVLDSTTFDCGEVGPNTVVLTVTDLNGNSSTATATVTVQDNVAPIAQTQNITIQLDANGQASITTSQINNGSTDACGIVSLALDSINFDCGEVGPNTVVLTVTDLNGNSSTATATVTVQDNVAPIAQTQNITIQLDANGQASITTSQINNGSTDACGIVSLALDSINFDCSEVGANTVVLTVTDVNGNSSTATATVTVQDNVAPIAQAQNITVQLDANGQASITPSQINNGSSDACGIASLALDSTNFDCGEVGANTVTLTVTDVNGNSSTATATVTVQDNVAPIALAQNITIQLNAVGQASITPSQINNVSSDACGIASLALDSTNFDCGEVGANTVVLTVTDINGNSATATATVTVQDNISPIALAQNITIQLNANGQASITPSQINNGSNDACGIASLALDSTTFDCGEVGANTVTLTVTDVNGNSSTATATVTVQDNIAPVALAQNITIQLDANGQASITPSQINNGSTDACGIASLALDSTNFDCGEVGSNTVLLTVTDVNGNSSTATAIVTVQDNVAPIAQTQNITIQLDANGQANITPSQINNGSTDACGIASLALDSTNFDCSEVGANTVVLTVTDVNGNSSTATATVTVQDNVAPIAQTQNITIQLDANGQASITPSQINNGSSDACGIASLVLDSTNFDCGEVRPNTVTLTVTDVNGNSSTATATVIVQDNVSPIALAQNITIQLDANGQASITPSQINNGSSDACGITSLMMDSTHFDCGEVGANTVVLTVTDVNGNISTATATVTVQDNVAPIAQAQNITVQLDANGQASITPSQINNGSTDACGIASLALDSTNFDCGEVGSNTVLLTVTDVNGNSSTATAIVTVQDNVAPIALAQNIAVQMDANGQASITPSQINNGSSDACGIASLMLDSTHFDCGEVGANTIVLTVTDVNGNSSTATATVTVQDNVAPIAIAQNITIQLDANGQANITPSQINNGSNDACGIASLMLDSTNFDCGEVGANTVVLTVTDVNGNSSTAIAIVMVVDNIAPEIVNTPINIAVVSSSSICGTNVSWTTPSVVENCSATLVGSHVSGSFFNLGLTTVNYEATDVVGNTDTSSFTVYVYDTTSPTILNVPTNITVNATVGQCSANVTWTAPTAIDNCSATLTSSFTPGANFPIGTTVVTYTAIDLDNNISAISFTVTVIDNQAPSIINMSQNIIACEGTVINYPNPTATDNCGLTTLNRISGFDSGIVFPVGVTTVTYQAADLNGNISTSSFTVTINPNPIAPILTANGPTSFCDGGSVVISANQTTGLFWSNGATTATVTVNQTQSVSAIYTDGNGCVSPTSNAIQVTEFAIPNAPVIAANGSATICEGNVVEIISNQNTGNLWSNGSTNTSINVSNSGAYSTVFFDANGCQSSVSNSIIVSVVARPATPIISSTDTLIFCEGSTATLTASGNNIVWSNGIIGNTYVADTTGSYFAVAIGTLQGCNSYESNVISTIVRENPPLATISKVGSNIVSDIHGAYFYDWYLNGALIVSNNNSSIPYTVDGDYQLILRNNFGCTTASNLLQVNTVGIDDITDNQSFLVYPNPSRADFVFKTTNSSILRLNIYDDKGKLVTTYQNRFTEGVRIGENLANGVYIITVEENNQIINTQRIIKIN